MELNNTIATPLYKKNSDKKSKLVNALPEAVCQLKMN